MVTISKQQDKFRFEVKGMHKLWAFKSELIIPAVNILNAHQKFEEIGWWKGLKAPGTHIPFLITAGTFHLEGDKIFWDVVNKENSVIVDLKDEYYKQLIVEVEDPDKAIALLTNKQP